MIPLGQIEDVMRRLVVIHQAIASNPSGVC
jgi:hypothetical protein